MKKFLQILFLFLIAFVQGTTLKAQNLVLNPSFEVYIVCPSDSNSLPPIGWDYCSETPDYFNSCATVASFSTPNNGMGYQIASDGNAYCGFFSIYPIPKYREYIGSQLIQPLQTGLKYYFSAKISRANNSNCASNNIGVLFTTNPFQYNYLSSSIINYSNINTSQIIADTNSWTFISGYIIADSVYKYVYIGNFFNNSNTDTILYYGSNCYAYYFIDNVCVSEDSLTCNSVVSIGENSVNKSEINIYPNPANKFININCNYSKTKTLKYFLSDSFGRIIKQGIIVNNKKIDVSKYTEGIYFLNIKTEEKIFYKKVIIYKP